MLLEPISLSGTFDTRVSARGVCSLCGREHTMVIGYAAKYARRLFSVLEERKRIDLHASAEDADPRLTTKYLWGEARGQMFGVLVVRDVNGRAGVLKAFSGQYNGLWDVDGWVPPLIDVEAFRRVTSGVERLIKRLGARMEALPADSPGRKELFDRRKALSQALMRDIHAMYKIPNLCGEVRSLPEVALGDGGLPTGIGDCCGPKLIGYAARHSLTPLGLVEFYVGRENRSGTRKHGGMYSACKDKCERIMGYMLCEECRL